MEKNDKWSQLSMKDRMELIKLYTSQGIYDLKEMRSHYNGVPYRDLYSSDYDYFNAHPSNIAKTEYEHSTSRNPKTGQLLKSETHPTFDLMINGEKQAGYKVVRGDDGNLYSIPNRSDNYVEDYNSFSDGGDTENPVNMGELEASLITPRQSRINRRREVRRAFRSIKNLIKSDEIDSQDILNAYNGLNEDQRKRAMESAMKFSPAARPDLVLDSMKRLVKKKPRKAFRTLRYIMTGKGKPEFFDYGYEDGYNGLWTINGDTVTNGIIDAMIYGTAVDPRIGTEANKEDFGPILNYIDKYYNGRNIQYIQTNPGVTTNQEGIVPVSYTGSHGSFNISTPHTSINNQGFTLEKGTRNDSTFVRGLDVYDFQSEGYSKKWKTEKMYPVIKQIDENTNPVAIKTPWVPEQDINKILSDKDGYVPYKSNGGSLNRFATGGDVNIYNNKDIMNDITFLDSFEELNPSSITSYGYDSTIASYLNNRMLDNIIQERLDRRKGKRSKRNSITSTLVPLVIGSRILDGEEVEQTLSGTPYIPLTVNTYEDYKNQQAPENKRVKVVPEAPIDNAEIVRKQAWAESAGNDKAGSSKGAKGRYQIMPNTLEEYQKATGDIGNIYNPKYNRKVRDWEFNRYANSDQVNRGNPTDSVRMGRRLAIYNYGYGNVRKVLNKADSLGIDIDSTFNWLDSMPKETRDYVNFILRNKDTGDHRNSRDYRRHRNKMRRKRN